jgi:hypothetical protein
MPIVSSPLNTKPINWSGHDIVLIYNHGIECKHIPSDLYNYNTWTIYVKQPWLSFKIAKAIQCVTKCVDILSDLLFSYDKEMKVTEESGGHVLSSFTKDNNIILNELIKTDLFFYICKWQATQAIKKSEK